MRSSVKRLLQVALSAICFICAAKLHGADILWDGSSSPDWNTDANWAGNAVPGADDIAVFDPDQQAISRWNFRLDANAAVAGLRFTNLPQSVTGDASGDFTLSIGSNGLSVAGADVTLDLTCDLSADQSWSVAGSDELILSGELSGSSKLTKSGAGRAWLTGDSTFSGEYCIAEGTLKGAIFTAPVMDGLEVWMDAAEIGTIVTNASGAVTSWTDKAGGELMTPVGAGGGPLYGATLFNGRPGMRFDKDLKNGLLMASGYANTTNVATAFVMMQRRSSQVTYGGLLSLYKNGSQDYDNANSAAFYHFDGSASYSMIGYRNAARGGQIFLSYETPFCLMSRFNGSSHTLVQDGVIAGGISTDSRLYDPFNADRLLLGNRPVANYNYPFNGDVAEVLVYNRVLTATEEQQVTEYLSNKWKPVTSVDDVLNDAALWFDASDTDSITTNASGVVTAWANLVSENALIPNAATNNIAYVETAANGAPAVRFNYDIFNYLQSNGGYHNRGDELTFFVSLIADEVQLGYAGVASVFDNGTDHGGTARGILMYLRDQSTGLQWSGYRDGTGLSYSYTSPGMPAVAMSRYDGAEHTFIVNGDAIGTAVASQGNFNAYNFRLGNRNDGANRAFNGDIQEVLVFNRRLSPTEEQLITEYLDAKWVATTNSTDILSDADVHLDASATSSIMTDVSGNVTNWANLVGSSVMTVPTTNVCVGPQVIAGGMNGLPVLRFNPSQKTALFMESGYTNTEAQVNAFIVMRRDAGQPNNTGLLSIYASSGAHDYNNAASAILAIYSNNETITGHRSGSWLSSITDIPYNAPVCLHSAFNGVAHTMALNNGSASSSSYIGKLNSDQLCLGSRYENSSFINHFSGDIAEVLIYNRALSPDEKALINDYLTAKWMPETSANQLDSILESAELWLDASADETIATDGNGQITAWSNLVDNSAVALLPPAGLKGPLVYSGGMNDKPVLRFDKDAATKQALMIDTGFAITGIESTAVIMMQTRSTQSGGARLANLWKDNGTDHNDIAGGIYGYFYNATSLRGHRAGAAKSGYSGLPFETPTCIISRYDGSRHRMIKDEFLCGPVNSSGEFNANRFGLGFRLGADEWFNGDIAEVLVFNYALNPDQQQIIYNYLQEKWVNPESTGTLEGSQLIEVNSGAELDVRDINGLTLNDGASLSGAGRVAGDVTVTSGATIEAVNEGADSTLAVSGDLTFESGSTVAINYLDEEPLINASGLLTLPAEMSYAITNLVTSGRGGKIPVIRGSAWDNGMGGTPASTAWLLEGDARSTSFLLDENDFSVNLQILGGTIILVR